MPTSTSALPPINQQDKTVTINGKTFTFAEILTIISSNGSLTRAAKDHDMKPKQLRDANAYIKNFDHNNSITQPQPLAQEEAVKDSNKNKTEAKINTRVLENQKLLNTLIGVMIKNVQMEDRKIKNSNFFSGIAPKVRAGMISSDLGAAQALKDNENDIPDVLEDIRSLMEKQIAMYQQNLDADKNRDRTAEETRQENLRKYGNEKGFGNWLVNGAKDKKEQGAASKLAETAGGLAGNLMGLLIDPKFFARLIGFNTLQSVLPKLLKSRVTGLALAIVAGTISGIEAMGHAEEWGVSDASAAIAGFLGGSAKGGLINALTTGAGLAFAGATIGAVGGPVGILAGALIGGALGIISGLLGAEKLSKMIDGSTKELTAWWKTNVRTIFDIDPAEMQQIVNSLTEARNITQESLDHYTASITDLESQIAKARADGDTALVNTLVSRRNVLVESKDRLEQTVIEQQARVDRAVVDQKRNQTDWWRLTDHLLLVNDTFAIWANSEGSKIQTNVANAWQSTAQNASDVWEQKKLETKDAADWVGTILVNMTNATKKWFISTAESIGTSIGEWEYDASWIGEGMTSIIDGMKEWWFGIADQIKNTFSDPGKLLNQVMGWGGPSNLDAIPEGAAPIQVDPMRSSDSTEVWNKAATPQVTTDFFVMKHLRDLEMRNKIIERNQSYSKAVQPPGPMSSANPNIFSAPSDNRSYTSMSSTSIAPQISPLNQTIIGNF